MIHAAAHADQLVASHHGVLVALSMIIAVLASYVALDLGGRIRASSGLARGTWLVTAAIALGGGIWSMHFVAMLAFRLPVPVTYDPTLTILSLLLAILVTAAGFKIVSAGSGRVRLLFAGTLMGLGIVTMHYTGMEAMRMDATLTYHRGYVAMSVVVAVVASICALRFAFANPDVTQRVIGALFMGMAISGMHYVGMHAAVFTGAARGAVGHIEQTNLAFSVSAVTVLILAMAMVAAAFDRRFAVLAEREAMLLRQSEENFRRLFRHSPLPLYALDERARIVEVSDAWLELLAYRREEVIRRPMTKFVSADALDAAKRAWAGMLRNGRLRDLECRLVAKSGQVVEALVSARVERSENGEFVRVVGGIVDITARKTTEEQLRQAQKMEAVGQLTGGIAHDFNNLLTIVMGNLDIIRRQVEPGAAASLDRVRRATSHALEGVKRAAALTERLLAFSRRQTLRPRTLEPRRLVEGMTELLSRAAGEKAKLLVTCADDVGRVEVDANQLEASILNLAINARDAMTDTGLITITVENLTTPSNLRDLRLDVPAGEYVAIRVADNGMGMSDEVRRRAFEPFFTTKRVGQGTGLGLSQVYGFAHQSGGDVLITSAPGAGTTVHLVLPRVYTDVETDDHPALEAPAAAPGEETLLIVEDDHQVRAITVEALAELGYDVVEAEDAPSALELIGDAHRKIDLLLSDIVLPGMSGRQLVDQARRMRPGLKVLLMSGYDREHGAAAAGAQGVEVLRKPLAPSVMAERVRAVLDRAAPRSAA
jgi:PAS domain S-box-containing protein